MNMREIRTRSSGVFLVGLTLFLVLTAAAAGWLGSAYLERSFSEDSLAQVSRAGEMLALQADSPNETANTVAVMQELLGGSWIVMGVDGEALFGDADYVPADILSKVQAETSYFGYMEGPESDKLAVAGVVWQADESAAGILLYVHSAQKLVLQQNIVRWATVILLLLIGGFSWLIYQRATEGFFLAIRKMAEGIYAWTEEREPEWPDVGADGEMGQLVEAVRFFDVYRKNKEGKSIEEYERLDRVISNLREGILLVNEMKRIMYGNRAAGDLLGYEFDGLSGEPVQEIFRDYDLNSRIDQTVRGGEHAEYRVRTVLPSQKLLKADIFPLPHKDEDDPAVLIVLQDESEIEKLTQMRTDFVANVSHELRTPLTSIKGFAETILDSGMSDVERVHRFVEIIESEADRLTRLIDDLLDLARIESGRIRLDFKRTSIRKVIQDTVEKLIPQLEKAEIALDMETEEAVTPLLADPDRLAQVIINYVDNSMKYTHKGGSIRIKAFETENEILVEVTDNGVGIPAQDLERVFERFYRVDKARTRSSGGTGLGLAIVKHIIEAHGGKVFVRSTAGAGSTFGFSLPKGDE
jgi:two-component system, OmpR family, phosphate regulon sensor histidine kinase PhoR